MKKVTMKQKICQIQTKNSNSIKNFDLSLSFGYQNKDKLKQSKQQQQQQISRLMPINQKAQQIIKSIKIGRNCQLTQTQQIQHQDSQKLMNFVIGGYIQNDFNQYLSIKQFNKNKQDFQVLNDIYQTTSRIKGQQRSQINIKDMNKQKWKNHISQSQFFKQRSLLSVIYLNTNMEKLSRMKIQAHMKKHKIVW